MRKLLSIMMVSGLLLVPLSVYADSGQQASTPPPVAAPLVREGDLAVKLAGALNLGTPSTEAEAESLLIAVNIAPRNGWISDYPVTPDILAELEAAVGNAADTNKLSLGKDDSLKALQAVEASAGLAVVPTAPGPYAETQPPTAPEYLGPSVIDSYYYDQGPPIVSYYPPPWNYNYLYAWVPSPFWCGGFFFPGFFILHDFDRTVFIGGHRFLFTNHVFDHDHHRFFSVDPERRWRGGRESFRTATQRFEGRRFGTPEARRGAESTVGRSHDRMASGGSHERNSGTPRGQTGRFFNGGRGNGQMAPRGNFRGTPGGPDRSSNRNGGRSFGPPMRNEGRAFSLPRMRSGGRSFSPPSMGSRGFSGGFHGGGHTFSRGFSGRSHGSSFGHGGSFGGFHGGGFGGRR